MKYRIEPPMVELSMFQDGVNIKFVLDPPSLSLLDIMIQEWKKMLGPNLSSKSFIEEYSVHEEAGWKFLVPKIVP